MDIRKELKLKLTDALEDVEPEERLEAVEETVDEFVSDHLRKGIHLRAHVVEDDAEGVEIEGYDPSTQKRSRFKFFYAAALRT